MSEEMRGLFIGSPDFREIIEGGYVYVDKTGSLRELLKGPYVAPIFLSRPRRFGKTTLIDTCEEILLGNRELFEGLEIGKPESGHDWKSSNVIRIDMSYVGSDADNFDALLTDYLTGMARNRFGLEIKALNGAQALGNLITTLYGSYRVERKNALGETMKAADMPKVCILIDEYDYPLNPNVKDPPAIERIQRTLRDFYSVIKSSYKHLRFVFITGITKYRQLSLFSSMNNVNDISFKKPFSDICGFTEEEVLRHFGEHLRSSLHPVIAAGKLKTGSTVDDLFGLLLDWYNGYCWDGQTAETRVMNPISLLEFLDNGRFDNYWFNTGTPAFIRELDLGNELYFRMLAENFEFNGSIPVQEIGKASPEAMLAQSGYLTVKRVEYGEEGNSLPRLGLAIPNNEIRKSIAQVFHGAKICPEFTLEAESRHHDFVKAFCSHDETKSARILSYIFASLPYGLHVPLEAFYHAGIILILESKGADLVAEASSAKGRADLIVKPPNGEVLVVEIKHVKGNTEDAEVPEPEGSESGAAKACALRNGPGAAPHAPAGQEDPDGADRHLDRGIADAFEQAETHEYALPYLGKGCPVYLVAIAVYDRTKVRIRFRMIPQDG
jgi:hypothetical protein